MGYLSTLTGEIAVEPPISWREYKASRFAAKADGGDEDTSVMFRLVSERTETEDGEAVRHSAPGIVSRYSDAVKHHDVARNLREIAKEFGEGRTFIGWLIREGSEQGDVERYRIISRHGDIETQKAVLAWPDGEAV